MRRLGMTTLVVGIFAAAAADATVIVTGGGPSAHANGAVQALAVDPVPLELDDSYSDTKSSPFGNGSLPGGGIEYASGSVAAFDGESTVVGSFGTASYGFQFAHINDGSLSSGSIELTAYTGIGMSESYFEDPDPDDGIDPFALALGRAEAIQFIDLEIVDVDYLFDLQGSVQDDNAGLDNILSYFVSLADTTGGFTFLALYDDETPQDYTATPFSGSFLLEAGRTYRIGIGAATDYLCTSIGPVACPTEDGNGDPVASAPQPPGFYSQSGSALVEFTLTPIPEPGTALLLAAGLAVLAARRRG